MIIQWLDDAMNDLNELRQYIGIDNPDAANNVAKQILKTINLLSDHPGIGRTGRVHNTRELVISRTPYIVPYQVINERITILRVLHSAMRWPENF